LADIRRMNVMLTRSKHVLVILGSGSQLRKNRDWKALVQDLKDRDRLRSAQDLEQWMERWGGGGSA
jgi:senataxin